MARFDKYDPISGGFRAPLGFAPVAADVGKVIAVDISGTGVAIKSVDGAAARGVICLSSLLAQGKAVDVMTNGEIVDVVSPNDLTGAGAGVRVRAGAAGLVTNAARTAANEKWVGWFVQNWRLIVRLTDGT